MLINHFFVNIEVGGVIIWRPAVAMADFAVILGVGLLVKALCTYCLRIGKDFYFSSWEGS